MAAAGLVITPFLLHRLGARELGTWLVVGQVLTLLGLLDMGVAAILPREVARVSAAEGGPGVAELVRRVRWLVWLQTPAVAAVAAVCWAAAAAWTPDLGGPLAVILAAFVIQFPFRVPAAILAGLQDLEFCGSVQAATWIVGTAVSVALVIEGWGLYALAAGWTAGQLLGCAACAWRLRARHSFGPPHDRGWPGPTALAGLLWPSLWMSVRQAAQLLTVGVDVILLGVIVGHEAVIAYSCTGKLISIVTNQPYMLVQSAVPAIAQLRAAGDSGGAWRAGQAVCQLVLLLSGAVAVGVVACNRGFVEWWVGADQFGGPALSTAMAVAMVARHWRFTLGFMLHAAGYDRDLALVQLAEGAATAAATVAWMYAMGPIGGPLGLLTGIALVSAPAYIVILMYETGSSAAGIAAWTTPWMLRFGPVLACVVAASHLDLVRSPVAAASLAVAAGSAYAVSQLPIARREPLRGYLLLFFRKFRVA
jgi:O-antigen/teichoic acid export membrane protein